MDKRAAQATNGAIRVRFNNKNDQLHFLVVHEIRLTNTLFSSSGVNKAIMPPTVIDMRSQRIASLASSSIMVPEPSRAEELSSKPHFLIIRKSNALWARLCRTA